MTAQKNLKKLIRARMAKTSESYTTARRQIIRTTPSPIRDSILRCHFPGNVPGTTALRSLLTHRGVRDPHTDEPFTEAMLFGIAGGIGVGVFSFLYEKAKVATFFLGARHRWFDDLNYLQPAVETFGLTAEVRESAGGKTIDRQLREALADGPCIAWVDMVHLPHRALPAIWSGGGYHVVTVYKIQDDTALIGDLTDEPISISLDDLTAARARIKKQKNRLLSATGTPRTQDLSNLVWQGLTRCVQEFESPSLKPAKRSCQLEALRTWAERMDGTKDKECWERMFTAGRNLWNGLASIYDFIEHYGTGGGLCRPLFTEFLTEAGEALEDNRIRNLAGRYGELGRAWTVLADAAMPEDVPLFREARALRAQKAELFHSGGPEAADEIRAIWTKLDELGQQAATNFPLSATEWAKLRRHLSEQIMALYEGEAAALATIAEVVA